MKKAIIISSTTLIILCVLIFGFTSCDHTIKTDEANPSNSKDLAFESSNMELPINKSIPDLYYGVETRFAAIKKSDIDEATTIYDFLNDGEAEQIDLINSVGIIVIKNNQQSDIQEYGESAQLTDAQLKILKSTDYFSHFTIKTQFKEKNKENGKMEERFFGPHITVVPDKQATYIDGNEALINYLKDNSKESMNVIKGDDLGAIKLSFIVTKEGIVSNVKHDAMTTGYPSIDEKFMELIKNIPGKWSPAENAKGEKMDYELVFTFGPRDGC
ncbi:hypothetical protein [Psychroserpens luteus]|uniref:TonB protein C-terminal n=1 Tax=Psychroserpens luteus TaxID=1434066 RepID=A0ABW5ZXD8_9FLAO|nr:hypothetical protein [Psychroserpens luteus]